LFDFLCLINQSLTLLLRQSFIAFPDQGAKIKDFEFICKEFGKNKYIKKCNVCHFLYPSHSSGVKTIPFF
jgi:hypothetical protein